MFGFSWRIENFSLLRETLGQYISSPSFEIKTMKNTFAYIQLYPKGMRNEGFISYRLCVHGSQKLENGTLIKLSFTYNNNSVSQDLTVTSNNITDLRHSFESEEIDGMNNVENLFLHQDNVDIECVIIEADSILKPISRNSKTVLKVENYTLDLPLNSMLTTWKRTQIYSKSISVPQHLDKFELSIKLEDYLKTTENHTIEFKRMSEISTATTICCQVSLQNTLENNNALVCGRYLFKRGSESGPWIMPFSFKPDALSHLTVLRCKIMVSIGTILSNNLESEKLTSEKEIMTPCCITSERIGQNLLNKIFEKGILCDVILQVGINKFPAHKCVLSGISDVFAAMFKNNMKEKRDSVVNITDFDADTVGKMLQFVYTGKLENIEVKSLNKMYSAADKYQIIELKELCSFHIIETLCIDSVCEVLTLADLHQDSLMGETSINFVSANRSEVFNSESWETFMETKLQLAATTMFRICKNS